MNTVQLIPVPGFPLVEPGDELFAMLAKAMSDAGLQLEAGDILVAAQKVFSKAENRYVNLNDVEPSAEAERLAREADKDPRQMQVLLDESSEVLRVRPGVVVVEHRLGYVHANAGMDKSNIESDELNPRLLLLPLDSDASAKSFMDAIRAACGLEVPVIINDSAGRAWRNGTVGFALGSAGLEALENRIGEPDLFGRALEVTEVAVADELAAAASFLMGQGSEACPFVIVRGASYRPSTDGAGSLIRPKEKDMFR